MNHLFALMAPSNRTRNRSLSFMLLILYQIIMAMLLFGTQFAYSLKHLQLRQPGSVFKIAIFADLHFGENAWSDWGPKQDVNSIKAMSTLLDREKPDFVVYLGDVVTANNVPIANASLYWNQATAPARGRGIPWASVFGNHDDAHFEWPKEWFSGSGIPPLQCSMANSSSPARDEKCSFKGTSRLELMTHEIGNDTQSFSQHGPRNLWPSLSNYVLQISSSDNPELPVAFMYFLDSGGGSYPEVISTAQAEWFKEKSEEINPNSRIPEILFWHIPSKAYHKVAPWFIVPRPCVGSINKERVCTQEAELGIMKILENRPSVQAVFVGHDHGNDWCCPYKRMWLCYARHTGYGGYGNWDRGARILEITHQPFSIKSWITMEDGAVHSHILLNSHHISPSISPIFLFLLLFLFLFLFFGVKSHYPALTSRAKTVFSPFT